MKEFQDYHPGAAWVASFDVGVNRVEIDLASQDAATEVSLKMTSPPTAADPPLRITRFTVATAQTGKI